MRITLRPKGRHHFSEPEKIEQEEMLLAVFGGLGQVARVGQISTNLAHLIGALTTVVHVSRETMQKIKGKHSEITFGDISALAHGFQTGRVHQHGQRHLAIYYPDPYTVDRTIKAVIKATRDGRELLLVTHHQFEPKRLRAAIKRGVLVRDWPKSKAGDP